MREIKIREFKIKDNKFIYFINETSVQSIIADSLTILVLLILISLLYINYQYLGDSILIKLFFLSLLVMKFIIKSKKIKKTYENKEEFIKYIENSIEDKE
jgi:hypothetical protein